MLSDEDKRRTAYHESGHALVGMLTPGADPVRKVSIIPRTMSLGVTISAPDVERTNYDEEHLITRIKKLLGDDFQFDHGMRARALIMDCRCRSSTVLQALL